MFARKPASRSWRTHQRLFAFALTVLVGVSNLGGQCGGGVCKPGETQTCVCVGNEQGAQTCASDGNSWEPCECGTSNPGDPGSSTNCKSAGAAITQCGCWGEAYPGMTVGATGCCSAKATETECNPAAYGYCAGDTYPWQNICQ